MSTVVPEPEALPQTPFANLGEDLSQSAANTFGWDLVFALSFLDVNTAIANSGATPASFSKGAPPFNTSGDFDAWQLALGGGGQNIYMRIPMRNLTYNNSNYGDAEAIIKVLLIFVPDAPDEASNARKLHLRLLPQSENGLIADGASVPSVEVMSISYAGSPPSSTDQSVIRGQLQSWFNEDVSDFDFIFASVNVPEKGAVDEFAWMKPTEWAYAVSDGMDLDSSVFGILGVTQDRSAEGLAHQVSRYTIPQGERAALLISKKSYLEYMLWSGLGVMFSNPNEGRHWPNDYFEVVDGETIRNTAPLFIDQLEVKEGVFEKAEIATGNFNLRFRDTCLEIEMIDLRHPFRSWFKLPWIDVHHSIRANAMPHFDGTSLFLLPGNGVDQVVVTKDRLAEWIELGALVTLLALNVWGVGSAIRSVRAGTAVVEGSQATATTATEMTGVPNANQIAGEASEGAEVASVALQSRRVRLGALMRGLWQGYRASYTSMASTAIGIALTTDKALQLYATVASGELYDFREFSSKVMGQVTWPVDASGFTPTTVAFSGGFQIAGTLEEPTEEEGA